MPKGTGAIRRWTDEELNLVRRCVAQELTFMQMVGLFEGRSRNALIGAAHRLGLQTVKGSMSGVKAKGLNPRRAPAKPVRESKAAQQSVPIVPKPRPAPPTEVLETKPLRHGMPGDFMVTKFRCEELPEPPPAEPPIEGGILLMDLREQHCRWPINDGNPYRFCGARKAPGTLSYCAAHLKRHYRHPNAAEDRKAPVAKPKKSAWAFRP